MEEPLYTLGANGYRVNRIMTMKELMEELTGQSAVSFDWSKQTVHPSPVRPIMPYEGLSGK